MRVIGLDVSRTFAKIAYLRAEAYVTVVLWSCRRALSMPSLSACTARTKLSSRPQQTINPLNIDPHRFLSALGTAQLPSLRRPVEL
jgi:hypothetical protein